MKRFDSITIRRAAFLLALLPVAWSPGWCAEPVPGPVADSTSPLFRHGTFLRGEKRKDQPGVPGAPGAVTDAAAPGEPAAPLEPRQAALQKAADLVAKGDVKAALAVADTLQGEPAREAFAHELRGTVHALNKDYAAAEASFRAMLKKGEESTVANFNVAEMVMLQGRYTEAEERFRFIEDGNYDRDPALADLCRFKRVVCLCASLRVNEAEQLLTTISDPTLASPGAQYARAVVYCARNNFGKAAEIILNARSQFNDQVENLFVDSFIEMRWGKRDSQGVFVPGAEPGPRPGGPAAGAVIAAEKR